MSHRDRNDVAQWVVFPQEQWEAERNRRSDGTRWLQATQPTSIHSLLLGRKSCLAGVRCVVGGVLSRGVGGEAAFQPGKTNIRDARENGSPGLLLVPLVGGSSSLDSFGAFNTGASSTTSYPSWMAQGVGDAGTVPGSRRRTRGSWDGGLGAIRLWGCVFFLTLGARGNCLGLPGFCHSLTVHPQKGSE